MRHLAIPILVVLLLVSMLMSGTLLAAGAPSGGVILLSDEFDDGDIAANALGTGSGFTLRTFEPSGYPGAAGTAVEDGGVVTLSGPSHTKNILSNDALDPTGTTMTWVVTDRPSGDIGGWVHGVAVGWLKPGAIPWTYGAILEMRHDRVVFDVLPASMWAPSARYVSILAGSTTPGEVYSGVFSGPVTVSIYLDAATWQIDATGEGVDIHKSGAYNAGYGLSELLTVSGGTLRASASVYTWGRTGALGSVLVTAPASTKADILIESGVPGKGLDNAPGLQKPFNSNSQASAHAGKKK